MQCSVSSNSPKNSAASCALTWLCRLLVGGAFVLGGWAKSVDPYGTLYKMLEYLSSWGMHGVPHEPVVMGAVALGVVEFSVGVCVLCGVLRHSAVIAASAIMCFMLPLTAYIAIAEPVADCGCFGDLLVIGNTATFLKNVELSAACVWLLARNNRCCGIFRPSVRWVVVLASAVYAVALAAVGYNVQPVVDFRPYPLGTEMWDTVADDEVLLLTYEKDGVRRDFAEYELPDSSWTYIGLATVPPDDDAAPFPVFDAQGEQADIFMPEGDQLVFVVPNPGEHFLTRSRFANDLARYAQSRGVAVAAIVGTSTEGLREWALLAAPVFDVYSADDTDLKTLVRGDIAAVYLHDGSIVWKRNLASVDAELIDNAPAGGNVLASIDRADDGRLALLMGGCYLGLLLVLAVVTFVRWLRRRNHPGHIGGIDEHESGSFQSVDHVVSEQASADPEQHADAGQD